MSVKCPVGEKSMSAKCPVGVIVVGEMSWTANFARPEPSFIFAFSFKKIDPH